MKKLTKYILSLSLVFTFLAFNDAFASCETEQTAVTTCNESEDEDDPDCLKEETVLESCEDLDACNAINEENGAGTEDCSYEEELYNTDKEALDNSSSSAPQEGDDDFVGPPSPTSSTDVGPTAQAVKDMVATTNDFDVTKFLCIEGECKLTLSGEHVKGQANILSRIIRLISQLMGIFAILLYIVGAYFMITSQGDENQLQKGKTIVIYTSIGLVLTFTSYIIIHFIVSIIYK